jgi:hypothetical protein
MLVYREQSPKIKIPYVLLSGSIFLFSPAYGVKQTKRE